MARRRNESESDELRGTDIGKLPGEKSFEEEYIQLLQAFGPEVANMLLGSGPDAGSSGGGGLPSFGMGQGVGTGPITPSLPISAATSAPGTAIGMSAPSVGGTVAKAAGSSLGFPQLAGLTGMQAGLGLLGDFMGGGDDQQPHEPYTGAVDPQTSLLRALEGILTMGTSVSDRLSKPTTLRSSYVQPGPTPVSIPGLPFQIGGGLGVDPANFDKSLLSLPGLAGLQLPGGPFSPPTQTNPGSGSMTRPNASAAGMPPGDVPGHTPPTSPAQRRKPGTV